jgi:hypothetical protein
MRNEYIIYGDVPVHIFQTQLGLHVEALDWFSGEMESHTEFLAEIDFDRSGLVREVTEQQFQQKLVEQQAIWREKQKTRTTKAI